jgi:hypothetical protein
MDVCSIDLVSLLTDAVTGMSYAEELNMYVVVELELALPFKEYVMVARD